MTPIAQIREQFPMYADIPDGELVRGIHRKFYSDMPYSSFLKNIDFAKPVDPTDGMSGTQKVLAGAGKAFVDAGRGVRQIVGSDAPTMEGLVTGDKRSSIQREIDQSRELDAPLMNTGGGVAGNIIGNAAMFAPTAAIPGANTYTGAALLGAAAGAAQPVATGESRGVNTVLGGGAGILGQGVGNAVGRVLKPVASRLSPEEAALSAAAEREGIKLSAGQATGSRPLQIAESVMENLPLTSAPQLAGKEAQQRAFTAAALRRAGIAGDSAAPEVLAGQKASLGGKLSEIAKSNEVDFNQGLTDKLAQITGEASKRGKSAAEPVTNIVDNLLAEVGQSGKISGETYQEWRQTLAPLAKSGGPDSHYYGQIRRALDEAFNSQMDAAGSEAWKSANRQYGNLKTIMQAAGGPGTPAATNQLAPAQLSAALRQSMGKEGVALGRGDLNELTRVGQTFVKDQTPNSGTAQRMLIQGLLTGGGSATGAGAAYATGKNPLEGAAWGAGAGVGALALPKLVQALMNSGAGQAYLKKGMVDLTPEARAAISNVLRTGAISSVPALEAR